VLANAARAAHRLDGAEYDLLLGATFVSIGCATLAGPAASALRCRGPASVAPGEGEAVVVVGFGRVGSAVADVLRRSGSDVAVVERSFEAVRAARRLGYPAVLGDAADPNVLDPLVGSRTHLIVVTAPETASNAAIVRRVRARSRALVVARACGADDLEGLLAAGARAAVVPEAEGALAVAAAALDVLGTPAERRSEALETHRAATCSSAKAPV
jgi:CPA2 family monovalent cation:H+ antiporter-2